ncbi:MAG TPA: UvrB/UvrC motif-containing protein [Spirochaetota bacterium]
MRSEVHLCESCAREIGFNTKISDLTSFLDEKNIVSEDPGRDTCPRCGMSSDDFSESRLLGCALCYDIHKDAVAAFLGSRTYYGTFPGNHFAIEDDGPGNEARNILPESVENLKERLSDAISKERYEDAAVLRDLIRDREQICLRKD